MHFVVTSENAIHGIKHQNKVGISMGIWRGVMQGVQFFLSPATEDITTHSRLSVIQSPRCLWNMFRSWKGWIIECSRKNEDKKNAESVCMLCIWSTIVTHILHETGCLEECFNIGIVLVTTFLTQISCYNALCKLMWIFVAPLQSRSLRLLYNPMPSARHFASVKGG